MQTQFNALQHKVADSETYQKGKEGVMASIGEMAHKLEEVAHNVTEKVTET